MANFPSMAAFGKQLDLLAKDVQASKARAITGPMAEDAQKIITAEARKDVGSDIKFSGWAPTLVTEVKFAITGAAIVHPTRTSAGPFTVAEIGRNQGNAGGFAGPGINRRSGLTSRTKSGGIRKQRARQTKRWNGVTRGFGTASRAIERMNKELPDVADDGMRKITRRHFDVS